MASEERKAQDKKIQEDNLFHSLGAQEQQAETDAFQCSRCKQVRESLAVNASETDTLMSDIVVSSASAVTARRRHGAPTNR
jgi:DNA-binding LytR/AlgR family response regulator